MAARPQPVGNGFDNVVVTPARSAHAVARSACISTMNPIAAAIPSLRIKETDRELSRRLMSIGA